MPALAILDRHDPQISIELDLAREVGIGVAFGGSLALQARLPAPLLARLFETGGRGPVERRGAVEAADLDVDRAGVAVAAPHQQGVRALDAAAPQVGLDPDFRFETHGGCHCRAAGAACKLAACRLAFGSFA